MLSFDTKRSGNSARALCHLGIQALKLAGHRKELRLSHLKWLGRAQVFIKALIPLCQNFTLGVHRGRNLHRYAKG